MSFDDKNLGEFPAWTVPNRYAPLTVKWSPSGDAILAMDKNSAWIWSLANRQVRSPWDLREAHGAALDRWAGLRDKGEDDSEALAEMSRLEEKGHTKRVFDATFNVDGSRIATASDDGTIKIWNRDGKLLGTAQKEGSGKPVAVAFLPAGLVGGYMDGTARVWDENWGLVASLERHDLDAGSIAVSPRGDGFVTAVSVGVSDDGKIRHWTFDGHFKQRLDGHTHGVTALSFSPDGRFLASGSADRTVRLWTMDGSCVDVLRGHVEPLVQVAVDNTGLRLLSLARDGELRLWQRFKRAPGLACNAQGIITAATYWSDDLLAVSSSFEGVTRITRLSDGETSATLPGMSALSLGSETVIAAGRLWTLEAVTTSDIGGLGATSRLHRAAFNGTAVTSEALFDIPATSEADNIKSFSVSPDGESLLIMRSHSAQLLSAADGRCTTLSGRNLNPRESPSVDYSAFAGDGRHLVTASINGSLWLWRSDGKLVGGKLIDGSGAGDNLYSVAFSRDGARFLTTIRQQAELWDLSLKRVAKLECATNKVKRGLFSPDGSRILTVGEAAMTDMRLWDGDGNYVANLPPGGRCDPETVQFTREARLIVWPTDRTLHVYDYEGRRVARLVTALDEAIRVFAFDSTGTRVAIGSCGSEIQLWSLEDNGQRLATLRSHSNEINSVQFSRDSKRLLTSSSDRTVREFIVDLETLIADAASRVPRMLTEEEIARYGIPLPLRFGPLNR
jgi:WD40 repeat protein